MMKRSIVRGLTLCVAAVVGVSGCVQPEPKKSMNTQPLTGQSERPSIAEFFAYQNDQGMMADMSISDIHFVPHAPALSGTGIARLERYAELLAASGGELCYETGSTDDSLIEARLAVAREFLAQVIPSNQTVTVVVGMARGRGMNAKEAATGIEVAKQAEQRDTAYKLSGTMGE